MSSASRRHSFPGQLALPLAGPGEHYDLLHNGQRGVVIHWSQAKSGHQWTKLKPQDPRIPELFQLDQGKEGRFFSVNEFDGWRYIRLLRSLRALYVDLDNQEDLYAVLDALQDQKMPGPSLVIWSGTGMHLYWLLEPLPPKTIPVWQRCQDALIAALKPLGADAAAKDCTRLLRIAGTRNKGEEVHGLVLDGHRWSLRQIAFEILGTEGKGKKPEVRDLRARRDRPDREIQGSIYARWHLVYRDLLAISNHHNHQIPEGHRDKWLFLCGVALSWFTHPQGIEDEILSLGRMHTDLVEPEISAAIKPPLERALLAANGQKIEWQGQSIDPRYRFRRQTLYDWLDGVIPDSLLPELRAIIPDEAARDRGRTRWAEREKARNARNRATEGRYATNYTKQGVRAANEEKRAQAQAMRAQGQTFRAIAAELGVSVRTVHTWCKAGVY